MEKKMETTMMVIWGLGLGFRRNGKENGNYSNGLERDCDKDPFLHS